MKSYSVKEVIKAKKRAIGLEERIDSINEFQDAELEAYVYTPLLFVACCGIMFSSMTLRGETDSMIPLIIGSLCTLLGSAGMAKILSLDYARDRLNDKLDKIYAAMPNEFRMEVYEEVESRKSR